MQDYTLSPQSGPVNAKIDYKAELNEEQHRAVTEGDGACLILAGAGSGKTRTITYRVAYLLEQGIAPQNILLLTFTNKAAKEMTERVERLLGTYPSGLWSGTFHSIANRILRKYATQLSYSPNFSILDQDDAGQLIDLCVKELKIDTKNRRFPKRSLVKSLISFAQNKRCGIKIAIETKSPKYMPIMEEIDAVADLYTRKKREQNVMDFDDLLINLLKLLEDHHTRDQLASNFQFILVDEFQDTNSIQSAIVDKFASAHRNLFVVGDDAQSIYSFRAAEIKNILDFPKLYPGANVFRLTQNYRSSPEILNVANQSIAKNTNQFKKDLESTKQKGSKPFVVPSVNDRQEAHFIADKILEHREQGSDLREIAVLFRAAFHSQALEFELMKRDIPYDYRGGMRFFERSHIKDAVAHLRIIHNLKDITAWIRCLTLHQGVGVITANKVAIAAATLSAPEEVITMQAPGGRRAQEGWGKFIDLFKTLIAAPSRPCGEISPLQSRWEPSKIIRTFAANKEYIAHLEHEFPNYDERLEDLEQFALFAEQYDNISNFLEDVSLVNEYGAVRDKGKAEKDKIILSTIHQAKGLEWDHVFVMHLNEGVFPHQKAFAEKGGVEEERRLFYVAVTRARRTLYMAYPLTSGYDSLEVKEPSMFIQEIPRDACERVRLRPSSSFNQFSSRTAFKASPKILAKPESKTAFADYREPTIELDEFGEPISNTPTTSFLRGVDEL